MSAASDSARSTAKATLAASGAVLERCNVLIPLRGGQALPARLYGQRRGAGGSAAPPLVLHFHAGAFVEGDLDSGERVAGLLAEAGARVVSIAYPLAGEHPFPAAVEAGQAALDWVSRRRSQLAGASSGAWLAGEEAGGNLAAAVALLARDNQHPALAGQILLSPMLDTCVATASLRDAHAGPVGCRWADGWRRYLSRPADALHPYAAPGSVTRLNKLPPTLLVTAQDDPLRDETLAFGGRLRAAGVAVDEALLGGPTGWPCSYMQGGGQRPAWADALVQHFHQFLTNHTPRGIQA